ncbi:MAG: hypothetical protein OXU20_32385 [Myxococcales bacterium]|nr:hypothetical protein [Myxococcales bacterium]MDD9965574.1 hypothetical protein [Myxococcales bacterium]
MSTDRFTRFEHCVHARFRAAVCVVACVALLSSCVVDFDRYQFAEGSIDPSLDGGPKPGSPDGGIQEDGSTDGGDASAPMPTRDAGLAPAPGDQDADVRSPKDAEVRSPPAVDEPPGVPEADAEVEPPGGHDSGVKDECEPGTAPSEYGPCEPCLVGEYCPGGSTPWQLCEDGTWDEDADPATPCVEHVECPAGEYVVQDGDEVADRSCAACAAGHYSTGTNAERCIAWSSCWVDGDSGTPTSDRVCAESWINLWGASGTDAATGVAVDGQGDVYVVGHTEGALPGQGNAGESDAFLRRYTSDGSEVWTRQFGSGAADRALGVSVDAAGDVYVVGDTAGVLGSRPSLGSTDAFVRKYASDGTELWTQQFGTRITDAGIAVATDDLGNVYVAGLLGEPDGSGANAFLRRFSSQGAEQPAPLFLERECWDYVNGLSVDASAVYLAGELGCGQTQMSRGERNAFVRRVEPSLGIELWNVEFGTGTNDWDEAMGIALDGDGGIYLVGYVAGQLPGQASAGQADGFVRKYDEGGAELWTRQFGTAGEDIAQSVGVDGSDVYVVGYVDGELSTQTGLGGVDGFVRVYGEDGEERATTQFGTPEADRPASVGLGPDGSVYIVGSTGGSAPGQQNAGDLDAFVIKLAP